MAATVKTLQQAVKAHQTGDLRHAETLYRRILRVDPHHADALHLLGVIAHQQGNQDQAIEQIRQPVALNPRNPIYHGNLGAAYRAVGRLDDAADSCQQAVQLDPNYAGAHYNLGLVLLGQGDALGAHRQFEQAVRLKRGLPEAWNSLGNACEQLGRHDEAVAAYREAVRQRPAYVEAHYNLGNALLGTGHVEEALVEYSEALRLRPDFPEALNNLGTSLRSLGRIAEAMSAFQLALQQRPQFSEACVNLGAAHASLSQWEQAEHWYHEALDINENNAAAWNNLGTTHSAQGKLDAAIRCYQESCRINSQDAEASGNLGISLQLQGRVTEADAAFDAALKLNPQHHRLRVAQALMLPPVYDSVEEIHQWRGRFIERLEQLHATRVTVDTWQELLPVNFYLAYQGFNDRDVMASLGRLGRSRGPAIEPRGSGGTRIRVGFLSRYFCNHTIAALTVGLLEKLPRQDFEIVVLSLGQSDDELARRIQAAADRHVVVADQIFPALQQVLAERLDVLFYPDIGMDPLSYVLAHTRLAPRQCVTWGHPVTTGLPTIDTFLSSDLLEVPEAQSHYTERLVKLSTLPVYYYKPVLPQTLQPRASFGLSETDNVYLCPQSLFKFHPEFDGLLKQILERDERGRLVLIEAPQTYWTERLTSRLRRTLGPASSRVTWVPRQGHEGFFSLLAAADVMLDPLHFGGGNTTYQALAIGLPIVSLPAQFMRGRATHACYRRMGLESLTATSAEDYVASAVRLGTDPEWNRDVRDQIRAANGVLYEDDQAIREIAAVLRG